MTSIPGVDYAWSHPGGAALQKAGKKFACRYLSSDASKNLSRAEADDLAAHGVSSVVVWETTAKRPLDGKSAGVYDAQRAAAQAANCGMPSSRPIYFAVDFDATPSQQGEINAYFDGVISVLGLARTGGYGGFYVIKRLFDAGRIRWGWQTPAWSGGQWDSRAVIRQGAQTTINGVSCDLNTATAADYGQWTPGQSPNVSTQENGMELNDKVDLTYTKDGKETLLWAGRLIDGKSEISVNYALACAAASLFNQRETLAPAIKALGAKLDAQTATIKTLAEALAAHDQQIDADALVARIQQAIESVTVHLDVPNA